MKKRKKQTKFIWIILAFSIFSQLVLVNPLLNTRFSDGSKNSEKIEGKLDMSQSLEWIDIPSFSNDYFSPDTSPGQGDTVLYSFGVNEDQDYTLNISAYYDEIDNYPGLTSSYYYIESAAYLMPNGTWLVAAVDDRFETFSSHIMLGIGTNTSNFEWIEVGRVNTTECLSVAGDESGNIRIVHIEKDGLFKRFMGVKCFSSNDWGKTWSNETLLNYTSFYPEYNYGGVGSPVYGISMDVCDGNFTCMWAISVNGLYENSSIVWAQEHLGSWSTPKNLTALPNYGHTHPQVIYNQTNNNGTLYVGFDYDLFDTGETNSSLIQLGNGINKSATKRWEVEPRSGGIKQGMQPTMHFAKDYITNDFYIIERTGVEWEQYGVQTARFGEDLTSLPLDIFKAECEASFNLFGNNGPKCFSATVESDQNYNALGILDCKSPFNIRSINGSVNAYETKSHSFNGNDLSGNSRNASAFSFNLQVGLNEEGSFDKILYVDNIPIDVHYTYSSNQISPFTSPGTNDAFQVDIEADKAGTASFNIRSKGSINKTMKYSKNIDIIKDPVLCGTGLDLYLFYTNFDDPVSRLLSSKSTDGGLSWEEPILIDEVVSNSYRLVHAAASGSNVYFWTSWDINYIHYYYVYSSNDGGKTFTKNELSLEVDAATKDLVCWNGYENMSFFDDEFVLNKSTDLGFTWETLCTLNLTDADNYTLVDAAYDELSGNYSFLLNHMILKEVLFVSVSKDGNQYSISENLILDPNSFGTGFGQRLDLSSRINGTKTEWIISSTAINSIDYTTFLTDLAYLVSKDGVSFGQWKNFTEINGHSLPAYIANKYWDVYFPNVDEAYPCFISAHQVSAGMTTYYNISSRSNYIFGNTVELDENYKASFNFNGVTTSGDILSDGNYTWELKVVDIAGYKDQESGWVYLDNTAPQLRPYLNLTSPDNPYPMNATKITIPVEEPNYDTGILFYRTSGDWIEMEMNIDISDNPYINFTGTIPAQDESVATVFWKAEINDTCGNKLILDNNGQQFSYSRGVYEYVKVSGLLSPTLYDDWTWTYVFTSGSDHLEEVWLRKEYDSTITDITIEASGDSNNTYRIDLEHDLTIDSAVYKFMYLTDIGQTTIIEEIELITPKISIEEEEEPPETIDLLEVSSYNVRYIIDFSQYIDYVYIEYEFDDGEGAQTADLDQEGTLYFYKFEEFPSEATSLKYKVIAMDIYGNEIQLGKERQIALLPEPPNIEMTAQDQLFVSFIALIVGVCSGIVFSTITERKQSKQKTHHKVFKRQTAKAIEQDGKIQKRIDEKSIEPKGAETKIKFLIILSAIGFGASITLAMYSLFILQNSVLSILMFMGSFLLTVVLWIYSSANLVEKHLNSPESRSLLKDQLLLTAISALIYLSIVFVFISGYQISWWRVRVAQNSFNIMGIELPRALMTVTTTFFSSIFLLTWATFRSVAKSADELRKAEELNENPLTIIERKEEAISTAVSSVGKKGILFIAIIVVVIIFSSDLNVYANQGLLILIPFVIGAIAILMVNTLIKRKKTIPIKGDSLVLDNIISCPHCQEDTPLGGNYCEHCGRQLLKGKRFSEGVQCSECLRHNTVSAQHCRYCGATLRK